MELEAITREFAQDGNEYFNHCMSVMGSRLEEAESALTWSADLVTDVHQARIHDL